MLVLPYEWLAEDFHVFLRTLIRFALGEQRARGLERREAPAAANPGRPLALQGVTRLANRLFSRNQLSDFAVWDLGDTGRALGRVAPLARAVTPRRLERALAVRQRRLIRGVVKDFYAASNRQTARLTGLDLASLGYDCSGDA